MRYLRAEGMLSDTWKRPPLLRWQTILGLLALLGGGLLIAWVALESFRALIRVMG